MGLNSLTLPVCFCLLLLVTGVEQLQSAPCAAVQRSSGRCEGHRLVSSPARPAGLWRGNGGPLPSLLEHSDRTGVTEYRHRLTGLQPCLVQTRQRAGKTSTYTQSNQMLFPVLTFTIDVHQVSTHGYSQNQILVWKYPSLTQVAKLTGHSYRVLYLVRVFQI